MSDSKTNLLKELMGYLKLDPENDALLTDVVDAALTIGELDIARRQIAKRALRGPLPPQLANLSGLVAMRSGDLAAARKTFSSLLDSREADPGLAFNYAWASAVDGDPETALSVLDETVTQAVPDAAALEVQLRHGQGEFDDAYALALAHLKTHPDHPALNAAASVLAMDVHDEALARTAALKGGDHPDALTTLALLQLGEGEKDLAKAMFDRAIEKRPRTPRAFIGRGLAQFSEGDSAQAAADLDRGAEMFETHLGSWVAAGWAHLLAEDLEAARDRFQRVIDIDDTFSEGHGALAVIQILTGDVEAGRHSAELAMRLDRESFSGALARTLLLSGDGQPEKARAIVERAMKTPIDGRGETLAAAMIRFGIGAETGDGRGPLN